MTVISTAAMTVTMADANIPGAVDQWYDGVDSDCDGWSDYDRDDDGYDAVTYGGDDCDDTDALISPLVS